MHGRREIRTEFLRTNLTVRDYLEDPWADNIRMDIKGKVCELA
jgi:hypothetical protein